MSQFAENPYKDQLSARAQSYGIKPSGAAHPHLELATTHLLHAIDRYLKPGAAIACLVPGTIFNGQHHAKLRDYAYLGADRSVPFELQEVWEVTPGTFKIRGAVAVGVKKRTMGEVNRGNPNGAIALPTEIQTCPFNVGRLGDRTAWVLGTSPVISRPEAGEIPPQGADLMPRPGVCVEIGDRRGSEWRVRTPRQNNPSYFAVKSAKKLEGQNFDGHVAPDFIHRMAQSLNLLPFALDNNFVNIAIPARRDENGAWEIMDVPAIRTAGYNRTARRFQRINRAMEEDEIVKPLYEKINERNKLNIQVFPPDKYLVLNGAGGGIACAALLRLSEFPDVIIDQTLYWKLVETEQEAWYRVGLINSDTLTEAIRPFNPEGELGPRHLHGLTNQAIPPFDQDNADHIRIADLARQLSEQALPLIAEDERISDPSRSISARRRLLRNKLKELPEYAALEDVSASVLGITG